MYAINHQKLRSEVMARALEGAGVGVWEPLHYPNPPLNTLSVPLFALGMLVPICTQVCGVVGGIVGGVGCDVVMFCVYVCVPDMHHVCT